MQSSIINHSDHAVHYTPMTYLFCNWKFVLFDPVHLFCPPRPLLPTSGNHQSVLFICELFSVLF